ncbi:MAG: CHASE3 domain-containing protein [Chryseolinea sp.]
MRKFFSLITQNIVYVSIFLMMALITLTTVLAFRNQNVMKQTNSQVAEAEIVIRNVEGMWIVIKEMDLGVRGYALTRKEGLLQPYNQAVTKNPAHIDTIRNITKKQNLDPEKLEKYLVLNDNYAELCKQMIAMVDQDSIKGFIALLEEDRGLALWQSYFAFSSELISHEEKIKTAAAVSYTAAITSNTILQLLLFLLGVPSLYVTYYKIRKQSASTRMLLLDLEQNNRKYVFDPGTPMIEDHKAIMDSSISNLKKAATFIGKITKGEYDASWPGMDAKNTAMNQHGLSGTLISMRDQMKHIKEEDENRIWITEGLTKFTEIIRQYQEDVNGLCDQAIRFITKYMGAQQGGVFLLQEEEENQYLEMVACYAFDKKKFVEKKVGLGEGLIGQAFLESSTVVLKEVPSGYTHITSGLGHATPDCVLIVPMRYNEKTEGVVEIAGFVNWKDHERTFIDKATEYMAASLSSVRSTQKMKILLEQMQSQTEELHAQEEEMRQNMEELAATNEEMKRNEAAYLKSEK